MEDNLIKARRDLAYLIARGVGIIWLANRLGLTLKPQFADRHARYERTGGL